MVICFFMQTCTKLIFYLDVLILCLCQSIELQKADNFLKVKHSTDFYIIVRLYIERLFLSYNKSHYVVRNQR